MGSLWNLRCGATCGLTANSGSCAWWYGSPASCDYNIPPGGANNGTLDAPDVCIPAGVPCARVCFACWYETDTAGTFTDQRFVQISTNGGVSYTNLGQLSAEPMSLWHSHCFDVTAYAGLTVRIRFRFESVTGSGNSFDGWQVDDFAVESVCVPTLTVTPNVTSTPANCGPAIANGSFEAPVLWGPPTGWNVSWDSQPGAPVYPLTLPGQVLVAPMNPINSCADAFWPYVRVVDAAPMYNTAGAVNTVFSGNQSCELWAPPYADVQGAGCGSVFSPPGTEARLWTTFLMPTGNGDCVQLNYAGNFMNAHPGNPGSCRFEIVVDCNGQPFQSFTFYDWSPGVITGTGNFRYLPWQSYFSPCVPAGCQMTMSFTARSCNFGAHGCFGYVDLVTCQQNCCVPPVGTSTPVPTPTFTVTATVTRTPTVSQSYTASATFNPSDTATRTGTRTASATATVSGTATASGSVTVTFTYTRTFTHSGTDTYTFTPTHTGSFTRTATATNTFTRTFTRTNSGTDTDTFTRTATRTSSATPTRTATATVTATPTESPTSTETYTVTETHTVTPTVPPPFFHVDRNVARAGEDVTVAWRLESAGRLQLVIFNSAGEYVCTIYDGHVPAREARSARWQQKNWRGDNVSSNVYILRVLAPGIARSYKIGVRG